MEIKKISKGVNLCCHKTEKFKTAVISLCIVTPLDSQASEKALLIQLLARTNSKYPGVMEMNRKLASLYGAAITSAVDKIGEALVLRLNLTAIDDRYTLENESVLQECTELLCSCLFMPDVTTQGFKKENVEREKRILIEKIESEKDEKRIYALNRMAEEMCRDEAYGISRYGEEKQVKALDGKKVFEVWKKIMLTCPIQVNVVGSSAQTVENTVKPLFEKFKKESLCDIRTEFITEAAASKTVTEKQPVKQGKLVIGFRAGMTYDMDNYAAIKLMTSIFGGGTYSKLFMNVREKMGLCYYCSARLFNAKGIIVVESGVETENAQKALEAIRNELDEMKKGNFTDEIIESAKMSICDSLKSVEDSNLAVNAWLIGQCASGSFDTPEKIAADIQNVSREEIILAANMVTEDTVYILEAESKEN